MTPKGTPTPAPMAVSREEDEDEDGDVGVSVVAHEVFDEFVEETANPATPGIAVPYGMTTCSSGQVTAPFA